MARIPLQLASRGLETGSPVSYSGASPIGQALEGLGNTLGNVADHQRALAERAQAQKDDVENFETTQRFQQLKIAADDDRAEIGKSTPASGMGFHDNSVAAFDKRKQEFLGSVPERLKPRMAALLDTERAQFSSQAAEAEYKQRSDWYRTGLTTAVGRGQEQVFNDPAALEAAKQEALREVDASGLPEPEKEEWRQKVRVGITQSLAARTMQDDPEGLARSLGVALPSPIGYGDRSLPAGMRNNNPGNIKFVGQGRNQGVIGPSQNTDQGDPQAVFDSPESGMRAAYALAKRKYDGGKTTANELIAGEGGWTPGNRQAAANVAASMGIGPDEDLNLSDTNGAAKFLRGLFKQEHGPASDAYSDEMIVSAITSPASPTAGTRAAPSSQNIPIRTRSNSNADLASVKPLVLDRFQALQNQWGTAIPINSGHRDTVVNKRAGGADKSQHLSGNALDLDVSDMSKEERTHLIGMASAMGFTGIGVYNNAIHLDMGARRSWGPSYHADSIPGWAQGAVQAHLAGKGDAAVPGPLAAPGVQLDPRFADLPFADRLKIANDAQKSALARRQAEAVANQAQYKSQLDSYGLDILTNKVGAETDILNAGFNDDDTATLLRSFRSQQKDANETDSAVRGYIEGTWGTNLNPLDSGEASIANKVFDKLSEQLDGQPDDVKEAATNDFIKKTGIIPQSVEADISLAGMSDDPAQIASSMTNAAQVQQLAPKAFASLPGADNLRKDLASFQHLVNDRGMSGPDAARKLLERRSPDFKRNEDVLGPEADKQAKDLAVSDVTNSFDPGVFSAEPGAGADPTTQNQLLSEYREVFKEEFIANGGDAADAKTRANAALSKTWGVSTVSGDSQLMKFPPEKFYPEIKGGFDYIKEDATVTAKELAGADVSKIVLRPDEGTASDVRAGRPPRYRLFYTREVDGQTVIDQAPKPWAIPTDMLKAKSAAVKAEEDAALQQQRAQEEESIRQIETFPQRTMDGISGAADRVSGAFGAVGNFIAPPAAGAELPATSGKTARLPQPQAIPGSKEAIGAALRQQSREMIDAAR